MTKPKPPAIITAQVVDWGNDPRHKGSIRIILHVPEEAGPKLSAVLGWPTYANPVPVALAHLSMEVPAQPPPASPNIDKEGARRLYARVGLLCKQPLFHRYVEECLGLNDDDLIDEDRAAEYVRGACGVESRKEILPGSEAALHFKKLEDDFELWKDWARHG